MDITRELPHSKDAEEAVLGSILINSKVMSRVTSILRPEDFLIERNQLIFNACLELDNRTEAIDITTVADELLREGNLDRAGGIAYLNTLAQNCVTSLNAEDYARDVYRDSVNRQIIEAGSKITNVGYENNHDVSEAISSAEEILYKVRNERSANDFIPLKRVLNELAEDEDRRRNTSDLDALERIPSGLTALDKITGGFQRSNLIVLGGRTSMGKTSLALNIAVNAALQSGATVAFFSLEMSRQELAMRLISSEAEIDSRKFNDLSFTDSEEIRRMDAVGRLGNAKIYIDDSSDSRISEIRSKARRLHSEHPLDLIIVDYLQFIKGDGKSENRVIELGTFSKALKGIARELNVPVIALAQLNRGAADKRDQGSRLPQLTDIRESGNIEQDADLVIFVHRDSVLYRTEAEWQKTHPGEDYPRELADIIVAKNRNGNLDACKVHFKPAYTKFGNLQNEEIPGFGK